MEDVIAIQTPAFLDEQLIMQHAAEAGLDAATIQTLCAFVRHIPADLQLVATAAHHAIYGTDTLLHDIRINAGYLPHAEAKYGGDEPTNDLW